MSPDLVLLDYHMPDWDGMHTTEEIRKINKNVPIIILTVDERQEIADSFLEAGATDFALKPIRAPDLISRISIHIKMTKLSREKNSTTFVEKGINNATLLSSQLPATYQPHGLLEVGASKAFSCLALVIGIFFDR